MLMSQMIVKVFQLNKVYLQNIFEKWHLIKFRLKLFLLFHFQHLLSFSSLKLQAKLMENAGISKVLILHLEILLKV